MRLLLGFSGLVLSVSAAGAGAINRFEERALALKHAPLCSPAMHAAPKSRRDAQPSEPSKISNFKKPEVHPNPTPKPYKCHVTIHQVKAKSLPTLEEHNASTLNPQPSNLSPDRLKILRLKGPKASAFRAAPEPTRISSFPPKRNSLKPEPNAPS